MKKIIYYTLAILLFSVVLSSCSDEGDDPKPTADGISPNATCKLIGLDGYLEIKYNADGTIKTVRSADGSYLARYSWYNNQGQITRIETTDNNFEFDYYPNGALKHVKGSSSLREENAFYYYQDEIIKYRIRIHPDGQKDSTIYTISSGNIIKEEISSTGSNYWQIWEYTFDQKKSPTANSYIFADDINAHINLNNIKTMKMTQGNLNSNGDREEYGEPLLSTYEYDYNSAGYPIVQYEVGEISGLYEYECK